MEAKEVKSLLEAYASIYMEQEQLEEGAEEYAGGQHPSKHPDKRVRDKYETQRRRSEAPKGVGVPDKSVGYGSMKDDADLFDIVKGYLVSEGATEEEVYDMMAHLTAEQVEAIVEQYPVGFRPDGRYQNADGSHTGPVMGALKSIFSGNLPKSKYVVPPTPQPRVTVTQTKKPVKPTPFSKGEDGKLTDFGAGGGDEKMRRTGMSVAEVEALGRKNKAAKGPKPYEQGGPRLPGRDM